MLLKVITALSVIIVAALYILGIMENFFVLPFLFIGCILGLILIWAISAFICTRFVDMKKEYNEFSPLYRFYVDCILQSLMQLLNIKIHYSGEEILPDEKFLYVCNHKSAMDPIIAMLVLAKNRLGFVAKKEIYKIPIIRELIHTNFCLALDRDNLREEAKTILRAASHVKEQRACIGIYPEGKRNKNGDDMLPFLNGSFKIAKKANCPIVVGTIKNSENIFKNAPFKRTHVEFDLIGIIDKEFVAAHNTSEISDLARKMMEEKLY